MCPLSYRGAPTITSEYPSLLTSPAVETKIPNSAPAWLPSAVQFGILVSTAGDVNNDGYSDVIVGAPLYDNGHTDEGRIYVYYGSSNGLSDTADRISESNQAGAWFGVYVSTAGDVNGDGYSDIIAGALSL